MRPPGNLSRRDKLKAKLEAAKTRQQKLAAVKRYNEKNHEVKRSCRRDKRRIDELAREAEEAAEQRDIKRVSIPQDCSAGERQSRANLLRTRTGWS